MSDWQPISTAPKDGRVIVFDETDGIIVAVHDYDDVWFPVGSEEYPIWPTHWMPLPEPPK